MTELIKAAKLFANSNHQRIAAHRNPAWQSIEVHLKSVTQMVSCVSENEETIAAAWLHDIVEDTSVTLDDIERRFGGAVAKIVGELTRVRRSGRGTRGARFVLDRQHFASVSGAAKTVRIADLIDTCRDLYKRDHASLGTCAREAREMVPALEGGDARLLERLKRDLEKYAPEIGAIKPAPISARLQPTAVPITGLRVFERAFTAQDIAEPLLSFDFNCPAADVAAAMSGARVEVAGVRRKGVLCGFVAAASLGQDLSEELGRELVQAHTARHQIGEHFPFRRVIVVEHNFAAP